MFNRVGPRRGWNRSLQEQLSSQGKHGGFYDRGPTRSTSARTKFGHALHEYKDELACAWKLVLATSEDVVARAYFHNDQALRKRLKLEPIPAATEIGAERICTRL